MYHLLGLSSQIKTGKNIKIYTARRKGILIPICVTLNSVYRKLRDNFHEKKNKQNILTTRDFY